MARELLPALALICLGFGPPALTSLDPFGSSLDLDSLNSLTAVAPRLPVEARASIVVDDLSGHPLASSRADERLAQASLTKLMTALVALDRADLGTTVSATERSFSEPTVIGLDPGDALPLEDMLYGLLLPSGNDAALAIAETLGGGSIERFVGWMNDRAAAMGLRNTHFANPTGLDAAGHYSSARDLAETARAITAEPTLARIVATPRYVVPGPPPYLFVNSNPLMGSYEGLDGVKTGFTDNAGRTFAASATRNGQRLIVVVLNSPDIRREAASLLELGFGMQRVTLGVWHPGFSRVTIQSGNGDRWTRLGGWEVPLLRAFTIQGGAPPQVFASVLGQSVARWVP